MTAFRRPRNIGLLVGAVVLSATACSEDDDVNLGFDSPLDVVVMDPNEIMDIHAGFVTNFRFGKITKLDLKHGTYLRDDPWGSWIRGAHIATGHDRMLEQITLAWRHTCLDTDDDPACSSESYFITLFASDADRSQLLVVPYLDTETGLTRPANCVPESGFIPRYPICIPELEGQSLRTLESDGGTVPVLAPREDADGDGAPDGWDPSEAVATGFMVREGHTSTETWTATWDATRAHFVVIGSRSGVQVAAAAIGEPYFSDDNEIEFKVTLPEGASLPEGAGFTFHTDSGIQEIDLEADLSLGPGAQIQDLQVYPDDCSSDTPCRLYGTVQLGDGSARLLVADLTGLPARIDPSSDIALYRLCPTASPISDGEGELDGVECASRPMAMDVDRLNGRVFVSEAAEAGGVYELPVVDLEAARWIDAIGPGFDVAYLEDATAAAGTQEQSIEDGESGDAQDAGQTWQHLFVASLEPGVIQAYDLRADALYDVNPFTPEVDPVRLYSPIQGIASSRIPVPLIEKTDDGVNVESVLLGATTFLGYMQPIKGENGCLTFNSTARAFVDASIVPAPIDRGPASNPHLVSDPETGKPAVLSPCGGISRSETWTFVFDEAIQGYRVRGSLTNPPGEYQQNIAYEDERYVSDHGEISVLIRAGSLPTTDGDSFSLPVVGNTGGMLVGELPADPALYTQSWGDRNQPWTPVNFRTVAVVASTGTDLVYKRDLAEHPNLAKLADYF